MYLNRPGFRSDDRSDIVTVGGGVNTERILQILRNLYMGGVKYNPLIPETIVSGEGPCNFFQCSRVTVRPENGEQILVHDVWKWLRETHNPVTYEIGLRWLLQGSSQHIQANGKGQKVAVLPAEAQCGGRGPWVLLFMAGGDGPYLGFVKVEEAKLWPSEWDFLWARELRHDPANPYCR